ncbi:hypothetical protein [Phyllobacterium sp. UNC302MFCol5.2]|uniref:hypothetical protein n=1 Tax=Phyllobacterium sp. UNC302MFCol5.2 TaxID=1449065 RepID=UPI0012DCFF19|nr:hypothetical protein [Phyllobacterium sp. UNC302MFCol5.2]
MRNDQRTFHIYDLKIAARKEGATKPTMIQVHDVWEQMRAAGRTYSIQAGEAVMLIGDININLAQQYAVVLLRLSDKLAPNSVYSDPVAGEFTVHEKVGDVGSDYACHVLISLAPEADLPNIYTCAVERVTGLAPGLVQRALSKFLHIEFNENADFFKYPSPGGGLNQNGEPRMDRCCPHVELRGRPSQSLVDDINNGRLSGISLIRAEAVTPVAGAPYLIREQSELKLAINRDNLPAQVWNSLQQTLNQNSGEYARAKVSYRVANSKRVVTVELNAATGEPLNSLYIEAFDIDNIFPPLAQSSATIVPRLITPAIPLFVQKRTI